MHQSDKTRREFLSRVAGLVGPLATGAAAIAKGAIANGAIANNDGDDGRLEGPADVSLRIAPVQVEVAPAASSYRWIQRNGTPGR